MQLAIPHELGREEARRRMRGSSHKIGDAIPGGMANVETDWVSDDRMALSIQAMGQNMTGHIDIAEDKVVFSMDLPPALSFVEPMVENAIRQQGEKMLAAPSSS